MDNKIPQCQYPGKALAFKYQVENHYTQKIPVTRNIVAPSAVRKQSLKVSWVHFPYRILQHPYNMGCQSFYPDVKAQIREGRRVMGLNLSNILKVKKEHPISVCS